jgi:hypothetical protein
LCQGHLLFTVVAFRTKLVRFAFVRALKKWVMKFQHPTLPGSFPLFPQMHGRQVATSGKDGSVILSELGKDGFKANVKKYHNLHSGVVKHVDFRFVLSPTTYSLPSLHTPDC